MLKRNEDLFCLQMSDSRLQHRKVGLVEIEAGRDCAYIHDRWVVGKE